MRKSFFTILISLTMLFGQSQSTKNFIDQPYIEVSSTADTTITPEEIYINIFISEKDTKDKISLEELEIKMVDVLKSLGINTEKDLTTNGVASNFKY